MIKYEEMKKYVFAKGKKKNGYFGDYIDVELAFYKNNIYIIAHCGYFRSPLPPAIDRQEACWLLEHHPSSRCFKQIILTDQEV